MQTERFQGEDERIYGFRDVESVPKVTYAGPPVRVIVESGKKGGISMEKKRRATMLIMAAAFLCLLMIVVPMHADAAGLNKTSVLMFKGKTSIIKMTGYSKKMKRSAWKVSGKAGKIVCRKKNAVKIRAVEYGISTVKIKAGKKTFRCTVRVIGTGASKSKVSLKKGNTSVIEVGKSAKVTTTNPVVVKVSKNGTIARLTAIKAGTA